MITKKSSAIPLLLAGVMLSSAYADKKQDKDHCNPGCNVLPKGCPVLCASYVDVNCNNLMFDVGVLLEQFKVTGTQVAYTSTGSGTYNTLARNGIPLKPHFKLDWGVTLAAGYYFSHDDWFVKGRFDWLRSTASKSSTAGWNQAIVPVNIWETGMGFNGGNETTFERVSTHLAVNYFNLDIDLNRATFISNCVSLEPHIGLKSSWINYKHSVRFDTENNNGGSPSDIKRKISSDFWGMGPALGFNSVWSFLEDAGLFFDNNVALLFGKSTVKDNVWNVSDPEALSTSASSSPTVVTPAMRMMAGVQWDRSCFNNSQHITFRLGVDAACYWNQYQHIDVLSQALGTGPTTAVFDPKFLERDTDVLGIIGLVLEMKWDF
ncbi:MAG: hypothetical protein JSR76_03840 [Verrucomicrobia bacterium]|nr:hypothetical protein [Verrucomicrobiota bacterium]